MHNPETASSDSAPNWFDNPEELARFLKMREDSEWAWANYDVLDTQYRGQQVAIWRKQVVAHGLVYDQVLQEAVVLGCPVDEVVIVDVFDPFVEIPPDFDLHFLMDEMEKGDRRSHSD